MTIKEIYDAILEKFPGYAIEDVSQNENYRYNGTIEYITIHLVKRTKVGDGNG